MIYVSVLTCSHTNESPSLCIVVILVCKDTQLFDLCPFLLFERLGVFVEPVCGS